MCFIALENLSRVVGTGVAFFDYVTQVTEWTPFPAWQIVMFLTKVWVTPATNSKLCDC